MRKILLFTLLFSGCAHIDNQREQEAKRKLRAAEKIALDAHAKREAAAVARKSKQESFGAIAEKIRLGRSTP